MAGAEWSCPYFKRHFSLGLTVAVSPCCHVRLPTPVQHPTTHPAHQIVSFSPTHIDCASLAAEVAQPHTTKSLNAARTRLWRCCSALHTLSAASPAVFSSQGSQECCWG